MLPREIRKDQLAPAGAKAIPLTKGFVAWVDEEDYEKLACYNWRAFRSAPRRGEEPHKNVCVYAIRSDGSGKTISMHNDILIPPEVYRVDHVIQSPETTIIDNRKSNLRLATRQDNSANARKLKTLTSIFKGVSWSNDRSKWQAHIKVDRRSISLGRFRDEGLAAYAYDLASVKYFGEFALTNFPVKGSINWIF